MILSHLPVTDGVTNIQIHW